MEREERQETKDRGNTGALSKETQEQYANANSNSGNILKRSGKSFCESASKCENTSTGPQPQPTKDFDVTHKKVEENSKFVKLRKLSRKFGEKSELSDETRTANIKKNPDINPSVHPFFNRNFRSAQTDPKTTKCNKHLKSNLKSRLKAKPSQGKGMIDISNYFIVKNESRPKLNPLGQNDLDIIDPTDLSASNH